MRHVAKTVLLLLPWLAVGPAVGADCLDYRAFLHRLDSEDTQGRAGAMASYGDFVYVCGGTDAFSAVDVSTTDGLRNLWTAFTEGPPVRITVDGDHAYVAESGYGLEIFDLNGPAVPAGIPTWVGGLATGDAYDVAVSGGLAYLTHRDANDLLVIDVSDPTAPEVVGSFDSPGITLSIEIANGYAYLAEDIAGGSDRLSVLDLGTPTAPSLHADVPLDDDGTDLVIEGDRAYVISSTSLLSILDISSPEAPEFLNNATVPVASLSLDGFVGYAVHNDRLRVLDLTNPHGVVELGTLFLESPRRVLRRDDVLYVADAAVGLTSIGLGGLDRAVPVGTLAPPFGSWLAVDGTGDFAFIVEPSSGIRVVNLTDPAQPMLGTTFGTLALRFALVGSRLYLPAGSDLAIYDVADPTAPAPLGSVPVGETTLGIVVDEPFAYVAIASGIRVVDVSDPEQPELRGATLCGIGSLNLHFWNDRVIGLRGPEGLDYYDVSNPDAPTCLSGYPLTVGNFSDAAIVDDALYVTSEDNELVRLALAPDSVQPDGGLALDPVPDRVTTDGSFLYATAPNGTTHVVDVRNGAFEKVVEWAGAPALDTAFDGNHVLTVGTSGMEIFSPQCSDIVAAAASAFTGTVEDGVVRLRWRAGSEALRFHVDRRIGDSEVRLTTLTVHDAFVDETAESGSTYEYDLILVSPDGTEFRVASTRVAVPVARLRLGPIVPNPTHGESVLHFAVAGDGAVSLTIHDAAGRRVRELPLPHGIAGSHAVTWNGRDERGQLVARGAYYVTLTAGSRSVTRKIVLVR